MKTGYDLKLRLRKELIIERNLIKNREMSIKSYNYSYIQDLQLYLYLCYGQ